MANTTFTKLPTADELLKQAAAKTKGTLKYTNTEDNNSTSLEDMLRDGYTMDELASTFMNQLREAQKTVDTEKQAEAALKASAKQDSGTTKTEEPADLDELREDLAITMFEYLTEIGVLPDTLDANETIDVIEDTLVQVEKNYKERKRRAKDAFSMLKTLCDMLG